MSDTSTLAPADLHLEVAAPSADSGHDAVPAVQPEAAVPAAAPPSTLTGSELRQVLAELDELRKAKADLERMRTVDAQLSRFTDLMRWQVDFTLQVWSERLLDELAVTLEAINAALYLLEAEPNPLLRLAGGYAMPAGTLQQIRLGEGLTGQVARTGRFLVLDDPKTFRAATDTSLARIEAAAFVIYPPVHDGRVEGVLEVSLLQPPTVENLEFLRQLTRSMAANLGSIRAQVQIRSLLGEAQAKSEALAAQEEEMRQNMEELEATQEEMRRVQQELEARQQEFQRMTNTVPGMIYQLHQTPDSYFTFRFVSEGSWDILGLAPEAVVADASTAFSLLHPEDQAEFFQAIQVAAASLNPLQWTGRFQLSDDSIVFVKMQAVPRQEADSSIIWDGIITDITREKETEQRLVTQQQQLAAQDEEMRQNLEELEATQEEMRRAQGAIEQQQKHLSAIIDSSDASVTLYDREYRYLVYNRVIRDRYAANGVELHVGQSAFETFDASLHAEWKAYYDRALAGEAFKLVKTRQDQDRLNYIEYDFRPVLLADGSVPYFALFSRDVTRFKELELNLQNEDTRLSRFAANGPVVLYQLWLDPVSRVQRFTYVSPNAEALLGYSAEALVGFDQAAFLGRLHPQDVPKFTGLFQAEAGKGSFDVVLRIKHGQTNKYVSVRWTGTIRAGAGDELETDGVIVLNS